MKISQANIKSLKDLLDVSYEICCYFDDETKTVKYDMLGMLMDKPKVTDRGVCIHSQPRKYPIHTHSNIFNPYPSAEDIINTMRSMGNVQDDKKFNLKNLIITKWGIWTLSSTRKYTFDKTWYEFLMAILVDESNALYHITEGGKILTQKRLVFLNAYCETVKYNVELFLKDTKFTMNFTPWKDITADFEF